MNETEREQRRQGIAGTDVAAILGLSPFAGEMDVWMEKKGIAPPRIETPQMWAGKKLESAIRAMYEEKTGHVVVQTGFRVHATNPLIVGTPDGVVPESGRVLEIKTSRTAQGWGPEGGSDIVPQVYLLQVAWYMALCNYDHADVAVLIGGSDFRIYHLERDHTLERYLIETMTKWWDRHITLNEPPALDGSDGTKAYLEYRYPLNVTPLKEATADVNTLLAKLERAKEKESRAVWEKISLENHIKDFIGNGEGTDGLFYKATWRVTKDAVKTNWERVAKEALKLLPDYEAAQVVAKNTRTKPGTRRFLFTSKEEE